MVSPALLLETIDRWFDSTALDHRPWPDPHAGLRTPRDEEYSRLTNPSRYRIVGARAQAWVAALDALGIARTDRAARVVWATAPGPRISSVQRIVARSPGTLVLVVARSQLGEVPDAGVVIGVGDLAVEVGHVPECGCDACDSGSQAELDCLDELLLAIVTGRFRHLRRGKQVVSTLGDGGYRASGLHGAEARRVLGDPRGWDEISGASWLER